MRTTKAQRDEAFPPEEDPLFMSVGRSCARDLEDALEALRELVDVAEQVVDSREAVDHRRLTGVDPSPMYHLEYEAIPRARALLEERQEAVV